MQKLFIRGKFILVIETYSSKRAEITKMFDENKFEFTCVQPFPSIVKFEVLCNLKRAEAIRQLLFTAKIELL